MKTFLITRFSINDHSYHGYQITRNNDNKTYQNLLFSEARLEFKFNVFENVTMQSVLQQTNFNWEWHIYYSPSLNKQYSTKLLTITYNHKKIKVFSVNNFADFFQKVNGYKYGKNYATVRLDDDDALSHKYVEILNRYSDYDGRIISFPYGQEYYLKKNKICKGSKCRKPNIALGLAAINSDIYACGDHDYIAKNYEVIYDLTKDMYLICCSPLTDTKRKRTEKKKFVLKTFINKVLNNFKYHITNKDTEILFKLFHNPKKNQSYFFKLINIFINSIGFQLLRKK